LKTTKPPGLHWGGTPSNYHLKEMLALRLPQRPGYLRRLCLEDHNLLCKGFAELQKPVISELSRSAVNRPETAQGYQQAFAVSTSISGEKLD